MSDALVAVVDTTVPLAGGSVEINGELVSSTSSQTLVPGDVVRCSDLDPAFLDALDGEEVLRPASSEDVKSFVEAKSAEDAAVEDRPVEEVKEEVTAEYVPPVDDGSVPGDAGRDLAAEKAEAKEAEKAAKAQAAAEKKAAAAAAKDESK